MELPRVEALPPVAGPLEAGDLFQLAGGHEQQSRFLDCDIAENLAAPSAPEEALEVGSANVASFLCDVGPLGASELNGAHLREEEASVPQQEHQQAHYEPFENGRQERSNSCSGAVSMAESLAGQTAAVAPFLAGSLSLLSSPLDFVEPNNSVEAASTPRHDLAVSEPADCTSSNSAAETSQVSPERCDHLSAVERNQPIDIARVGQQRLIGLSCSPPKSGSKQEHKQRFDADLAQTGTHLQPQPRASSSSFSSSRFFSSKLNTGSLWSLLSVGSSTSMSAINEIAGPETDSAAGRANIELEGQQKQEHSLSTTYTNFQREAGAATLNKQQQICNFTTRSASNFFNQFKPKISQPPAASCANDQQARSTPKLQAPVSEMGNQDSKVRSSRYRFNIKYIGSAMLHKNFTLPMLEWITKDIKRQTTRAAHGVNQRQFTIPVRDIMLEIHSNQLMGISCKDGHCIFVHPMHCVSKYAQLQHDSSSFAYIIRDSKDSPSFCHVFQTKGPNRVHEIFVAIREVTTRNQFASLPANSSLSMANTKRDQASAGLRLQKSASSDGHWKSLLGTGGDHAEPGLATPAAAPPTANSSLSNTPPTFISNSSLTNPLLANYNQQQMTKVNPAAIDAMSQQFENSYQFEVMFVKRVKLQCRRVPPSFVDDALETLKTFEAPKTTQIKGVVTKRIIGASVDERQEYDETCQSPTPGASGSSKVADLAKNVSPAASGDVSGAPDDKDRRGSSASLRGQERLSPSKNRQEAIEGRESKSCQQSPAKKSQPMSDSRASQKGAASNSNSSSSSIRDDLSTDETALRSKIKLRPQASPPPSYTNDFSPYNTITSSDLTERIAAIPVVSGSSVSLDHETRQKLARQVRETIMATAANIKKDVYASGDKLDAASSSRVLDSLSCTVANLEDEPRPSDGPGFDYSEPSGETIATDEQETAAAVSQRRSSAAPSLGCHSFAGGQCQSISNNFDLFRRASARQVVKNRTMLLLIGKDELCAISIDKHQMLFSKSFNSIVHCLSGTKNKDHFGLICRDSGKINPQAEAYAGFVFKCQSEKVVREIMGALKQVIYSSQHNYHGYNSPYNPLNSLSTLQNQFNASSKQQQQSSSKIFTNDQRRSPGTKRAADPAELLPAAPTTASTSLPSPPVVSLAAKRGFVNALDVKAAHRDQQLIDAGVGQASVPPPPPPPPPPPTAPPTLNSAAAPAKNPIKTMFCDDCPLYWFHRLCCDIESMPAEASKAIILRRIDSSLSEREQDEVFTKFSEHKIDSIEEHNEIFMSILRHLSERKQLKHSQTHSHQTVLAKNASLIRKQSSDLLVKSQMVSSQPAKAQQPQQPASATSANLGRGHQRSGSSGGSLTFIAGNQPANNPSLVDASSAAIDNLMRAKNSISVSIENLLKRRASLRDEHDDLIDSEAPQAGRQLPTRTGSFKTLFRDGHQASGQLETKLSDPSSMKDGNDLGDVQGSPGNLRRSQSTSDYTRTALGANQARQPAATWRDSLTKTLNTEDLTNPLVGFFKRRGSTQRESAAQDLDRAKYNSRRTSTESLSTMTSAGQHSPARQAASGLVSRSGQASPTNLLSGSFWKKSIFDMVQKTSPGQNASQTSNESISNTDPATRRSPAELRLLWRKAIREQITLLKMDKQNQKLLNNASGKTQQPQPKTTISTTSSTSTKPSTSHPNPVASDCLTLDRIKLNYVPVRWSQEAQQQWDRILKQDPTKKVQFSEVVRLVRLGVPMKRRGEIWMFLMNQYQLRYGTSFQPVDSEFSGDANQNYRGLLSQLSTQQHEIFVDIGRTFPSHPYYSQYLSIGQLSLFNLLKAYSLLDRQVGYCQGLSFVAGILLLHVDSEDEAFELMRHLMFNFGLRKQYLPSMDALHLQLYQMTRLLRDHELQIFDHFDKHDISPSLYAAPWFLTLFASQFPLGFVSRLLDLIYLIGIEAIFRVSLMLLAFHRKSIVECANLELTMEFMREGLIKIDDKSLVKIFNDALALDLRNKLIEYEIEYSFYCAEDKARAQTGPHHLHRHQLHRGGLSSRQSENSSSSTVNQDVKREPDFELGLAPIATNDSAVADATATVIIQHLLANNHLRSLRSNYSY